MTISNATGQIRDVGSRWVDAEVAGDVATLGDLTTDDFRLVGPFGFVLDKGQWLDRYRSGDLATTALVWDDVEIREYGETVVTIGTHAQEAAYKGTASNGEFRVTHVFVRDDDRWVIAHMQLSPTAFPAPPARHDQADERIPPT